MMSDMMTHVKKDGSFFSFQTSGGSFEAIFYEEKVVHQFFAGFTFGETFETILEEKKVDLPSGLLVDFLKRFL